MRLLKNHLFLLGLQGLQHVEPGDLSQIPSSALNPIGAIETQKFLVIWEVQLESLIVTYACPSKDPTDTPLSFFPIAHRINDSNLTGFPIHTAILQRVIVLKNMHV